MTGLRGAVVIGSILANAAAILSGCSPERRAARHPQSEKWDEFVLFFDSKMHNEATINLGFLGNTTGDFTYHVGTHGVTLKATLDPKGTVYRLAGRGPLEYRDFTGTARQHVLDRNCTISPERTVSDTFTVLSGEIDVSTNRLVQLTIDPGTPTELKKNSCDADDGTPPDEASDRNAEHDTSHHQWRFYWDHQHINEHINPRMQHLQGPWRITGWTTIEPGHWRKVYKQTIGEQTDGCGQIIACGADETTTIEVMAMSLAQLVGPAAKP